MVSRGFYKSGAKPPLKLPLGGEWTLSGVFPAAVPVDGKDGERVADYPGDEHNDFLAVLYADNRKQVRDAEEGEGDADKEGPELFHFGVGGDAQTQGDDAEDEVDHDTGVYIHFLAPFFGG